MTHLENKTLAYWNMSSVYHGKASSLKQLTTADALKMFNEHLQVLNPHRPLSMRLRQMQEEIIVGGKKKRKASAATVLRMAAQ